MQAGSTPALKAAPNQAKSKPRILVCKLIEVPRKPHLYKSKV